MERPEQEPSASAAPEPTTERQGTVLVRKLAPDTVRTGERFEYEIRLENRSDRPVSGIVLVESLISAISIVGSVPDSQLLEPHTGRWLLGPFEPHGVRSVRITCEARRSLRFRSYTSVAYAT